MAAAQTAIFELVEPLRADPDHSAVLLDIDGTLAPIVRHASDAHVPEITRARLIEVARRYHLVACVSGRSAVVARQIVSIGSIAYIGNHGAELLRPGSTDLLVDPQVEAWTERIREFALGADSTELQQVRVRLEDKGAIAAFHWRGAPDEAAAEDSVVAIEQAAIRAGLATHRGRKVLEVRPPVPIDKGRGITALLEDDPPRAALYVGDDLSDVDAFRALRGFPGTSSLCVGVRSDETPAELLEEADVLVDGPSAVRELLEALLR